MLALEEPGGLVDQYGTETFRVVCLKALDHEFYRRIVLKEALARCCLKHKGRASYHVGHREVCHVEDNGLGTIRVSDIFRLFGGI